MRGWLGSEARRFRNTVTWSLAGWRAAWATEKSLRQWTVAHAASVALALALDLTGAERALIVALGFLVLAAELLNTAIEEVVDDLSPAARPAARKAKDCGSAAVALAALGAGFAWVVILAERL
jgi:diacylglycerol kinase (ATP)